jgi:hypothetical protein
VCVGVKMGEGGAYNSGKLFEGLHIDRFVPPDVGGTLRESSLVYSWNLYAVKRCPCRRDDKVDDEVDDKAEGERYNQAAGGFCVQSFYGLNS